MQMPALRQLPVEGKSNGIVVATIEGGRRRGGSMPGSLVPAQITAQIRGNVKTWGSPGAANHGSEAIHALQDPRFLVP